MRDVSYTKSKKALYEEIFLRPLKTFKDLEFNVRSKESIFGRISTSKIEK